MLLFNLCRVGCCPRQADDHVLAQVKGFVVPPGCLDRPDREAPPLGKPSRHEATHERNVYDGCHIDLVARPKNATPACIDAKRTKVTGRQA